MEIEIVQRDDLIVLVVEGELDLSAAPDFTAWLSRVKDSRSRVIVIDLDEVSFMDSAAVHALPQFSIAERNRDRVVVTRGSAQVRRLFEVTGLARYLSFVPAPAL